MTGFMFQKDHSGCWAGHDVWEGTGVRKERSGRSRRGGRAVAVVQMREGGGSSWWLARSSQCRQQTDGPHTATLQLLAAVPHQNGAPETGEEVLKILMSDSQMTPSFKLFVAGEEPFSIGAIRIHSHLIIPWHRHCPPLLRSVSLARVRHHGRPALSLPSSREGGYRTVPRFLLVFNQQQCGPGAEARGRTRAREVRKRPRRWGSEVVMRLWPVEFVPSTPIFQQQCFQCC